MRAVTVRRRLREVITRTGGRSDSASVSRMWCSVVCWCCRDS